MMGCRAVTCVSNTFTSLMKRRNSTTSEFALYTNTPLLEVDLNLQQMLNSNEH